MHFRLNNTNQIKHEKKIYVHSSSCTHSNYKVNFYLLTEVDNIKYLGLNYDNNLKWYTHIHLLRKNFR